MCEVSRGAVLCNIVENDLFIAFAKTILNKNQNISFLIRWFVEKQRSIIRSCEWKYLNAFGVQLSSIRKSRTFCGSLFIDVISYANRLLYKFFVFNC